MARSSVIGVVGGGIAVRHTKGYNTASSKENCSNVSDSLSTNNKTELKSNDKLL